MKNLLSLGALLIFLLSSPAWADSSTTTIDLIPWAFHPGSEFPGATGSMESSGMGDTSSLTLHYNFTAGGAYVAAHGTTHLDKFSELRFSASVKPADSMILVRIVDSSGQFFQKSINASGSDFQNYRIYLSAANWDTIFGGNKSKEITFPITEIWVGVNKGGKILTGEATFKQLTIVN